MPKFALKKYYRFKNCIIRNQEENVTTWIPPHQASILPLLLAWTTSVHISNDVLRLSQIMFEAQSDDIPNLTTICLSDNNSRTRFASILRMLG